MDAVSSVALAAGLGWASGLRLYAVLFFLGLLHHVGTAELPQDLRVLGDPIVMAVSGTLFVAELCADKVPGFDTLWDTVHTFVRIPAGALLAAYAVATSDPAAVLSAGLLGGTVAAGAHFVKAGGRALINTSPEPFSNWAASAGEDISSVVIVWMALHHPLLLLGALTAFCCVALWLAPRLWRGVRRLVRAVAGAPPAPPAQ